MCYENTVYVDIFCTLHNFFTFRILETHPLYHGVTNSKFQSISKIMVFRCLVCIPALSTQGYYILTPGPHRPHRSYRTVDSSLRLWCRCRVMTFRDWYVYGSDVSGWCCAEFWRVKFVACTDMMCRDDAVSISDFLSFLGVRFSCIELMPYTVWTWWIWCVYGLNLSGRCCVELAVYDRMCRVKTV